MVSFFLSTTPGILAEEIFFDQAGFDFDDGLHYLATGQGEKEIDSGMTERVTKESSQPAQKSTVTLTASTTQEICTGFNFEGEPQMTTVKAPAEKILLMANFMQKK